MGTHESVLALNKQTADYVDGRTVDIVNRWRRVQESLGAYYNQLVQAATIHEVSSKIDGLLLQINDRRARVSHFYKNAGVFGVKQCICDINSKNRFLFVEFIDF